MKTLYMTKGLPASGKTTAAKALVASQPGTKRVNKDDLRAMIDGGKWSEANERFVIDVRDYVVDRSLAAGLHVVVDDTNLAPKHESHLKAIAKEHKAKFEILDFTNVSSQECIKRDLIRPNSVGSKVIMDMYNRYLKPPAVVPPAYDPSLPEVILCDIDGTIAQMQGRGPFEWGKVGEDSPRKIVFETLRSLMAGITRSNGRDLVFISGRDEVCRDQTNEWLTKHAPVLSWGKRILMRPAGDQRRDSIVKRELYERFIKGCYNVIAIFDDRPQVIRECWQELGFGDRIFNVGTGEEF
jgi:predicted kinase